MPEQKQHPLNVTRKDAFNARPAYRVFGGIMGVLFLVAAPWFGLARGEWLHSAGYAVMGLGFIVVAVRGRLKK